MFKDPIFDAKSLREVYTQALKTEGKEFSGPPTHPVLVDSAAKRIVNNVSGDICKMLCTRFNKAAKSALKDQKGYF